MFTRLVEQPQLFSLQALRDVTLQMNLMQSPIAVHACFKAGGAYIGKCVPFQVTISTKLDITLASVTVRFNKSGVDCNVSHNPMFPA